MSSSEDLGHEITASLLVILSTFAAIMNISLLALLLSFPNLKMSLNIYSLGKLIADIVSCLIFLVEGIAALQSESGFLKEFISCQIVGPLSSAAQSISIYLLYCIVIDPYYIIVLRRPATTPNAKILVTIMLCIFSVLLSTLAFFPGKNGTSYHLIAYGTYCYGNILDIDFWTRIICSIGIITYLLPIVPVLIGYYKIWKKLSMISEAKSATAEASYQLQRHVAHRGMAVIGLVICGYVVPSIILLRSVIGAGATPEPKYVPAILVLFGPIITILNSLGYYFADKRVRSAVYQLRGFTPREIELMTVATRKRSETSTHALTPIKMLISRDNKGSKKKLTNAKVIFS